jgi:hypothetical protein
MLYYNLVGYLNKYIKMNSFELLLKHIDAFIRKFYKNQIIKGSILFVGFFALSFLTVVLIEYFFNLISIYRGFLFYLFLSVNLFILLKYFIIPLFKLYSFGKIISHKQASIIIGSFFPQISDRLLNTLQLKETLNINNDVNYELIKASINQRSKTLTVIPFTAGINIKENIKYVKYVLPILLIFVFIFSFYPTIVNESTKRIVNYNVDYKPIAPFSFNLKSNNLIIQEDEDFPVQLFLTGKNIPENVYLVSTNGKYLMNKTSKVSSFYVLKRLKEKTVFYFEANGYTSEKYEIIVLPKTSIVKFEASIDYPTYIGKQNEKIKNIGDLIVPEGTNIKFSIESKNSNKVDVYWKNIDKLTFNKNKFGFSKLFKESSFLTVNLFNNFTKSIDSSNISISVIPDLFPTININEEIDSISNSIRFFNGEVTDDYGLSSLYFNYKIISKDGKSTFFKVKLKSPLGTNYQFNHAVDFSRENLSTEDKIEYYFEVFDNDGVNGSKSTKSTVFVYHLPSLEELNDKRQTSLDDSKNELNKLLNKTKDFQKSVEKLKKEALNSKSPDWNQMNQLNQIKEQQNSLQNELENLQMKMSESLNEKNQLSEMDKELLEKQELLQELLDKIMDDELKDLLNKLEEILNKKDKNQLDQQLDKLNIKSEDMNKQLDRSLEMLKRLQVNEKVDDIVKELKELSKKQEEFKNKIEKDAISKNQAEEKQNEINQKFEDLKKELDELKKLNEDLKSPLNLGNQDDLKNEITDELKKAKDNISQNKEKKANQNQSKSSEKMNQMADELESLQNMANKKQEEEDINSLRNILESLMILSFNQESIMLKFAKVQVKDPVYKRYGKAQRKIIDDTRIVEDSLNALAMRQPKISSFINKELNDINTNFKLGLENIDEHRKRELGVNLQYIMTAYNNLALMLNESLQQMQSDMQSKSSGNGSCDKPGKGSKPSDSESQDMKEMLKKQLEKMQKGEKEGGSKPGQKPGEQGMNMLGLGNKEIAKMAAEQSAIRQKLEQLRNELNKEGKGLGNQLNPLINELDKQEKDLINKQFSRDVIKRQKEILTRLLESEKALMERGFEEKRESKSGKNEKYSNKNRIDEYNKEKLKQVELLYSVDPIFKKYYKDKASEYFNSIN